jgi:hypothetical protein
MSQKTIKPPYWARIRRLARCIETPADLERLLEAASPAVREAMLTRLRPHLTSFELAAEPTQEEPE